MGELHPTDISIRYRQDYFRYPSCRRRWSGVSKEEVMRPTGTVNVRVGYEYAGFHPQKEQSSGHLLLLSNRFGRCIGGTHPLYKDEK